MSRQERESNSRPEREPERSLTWITDQKDRVVLLEQALREIEASGVGALVDHVLRVRRNLRLHMPMKWRVPYGLVADPCEPTQTLAEGKSCLFITQPQYLSRFTHLVVTDETAEHFVIEDLKIGRDSQLLGPLDLTFFALKYQQNDVLSDLSRMESDLAQVSMIVSVYVKRKIDGHGPKNFNGILWAEYDY